MCNNLPELNCLLADLLFSVFMVLLVLEERRIQVFKGLVLKKKTDLLNWVFFELVSSGIGLQQSSPIFPFASLSGNDFGTCWSHPIKFSCISQNLMNCLKREIDVTDPVGDMQLTGVQCG